MSPELNQGMNCHQPEPDKCHKQTLVMASNLLTVRTYHGAARTNHATHSQEQIQLILLPRRILTTESVNTHQQVEKDETVD